MDNRRFVLVTAVLAAAVVPGVGCTGGKGGDNNSAVCTDTCPTSGATRCAGTQIETCVTGALGCRGWVGPVSCQDGAACDEATGTCKPVTTCTDECPSSGNTRCQGPQIQTCVAGARGCLSWGAAANCPSSYACDTNTKKCERTCTDQCTLGATKCAGMLVQSCISGPQGCSVLGAATACPSNGVCSTSSNTCIVDPCAGVPMTGVCASATTIERCVTPTGGGDPRVATFDCSTGSSCQIKYGRATCVLTAACLEGETRCKSAAELETCSNGGWSPQGCPNGCTTSALDSFCVGSTELKSVTARLVYEALLPNEAGTDWDPTPVIYTGGGFLVVSGGASATYDAVYTDASDVPANQGFFTVKVPVAPTANDYVAFLAASTVGGELAIAVADPGFSTAGTRQAGTTPPAPRIWSWSTAASGLAEGSSVTITADQHSGAAYAFSQLRSAYDWAYYYAEQAGPPLVVWLGYGTSWDCGKCFADYPVNAFGFDFPSQVWLDGNPDDQPYWSGSVLGHELAHWIMWAYGTSPGEGGTHYLGVPTFPGQAWSEGWATGISSIARQTSIMLDVQEGTMFWFDISQRIYDTGDFPRPVAANGLLQMMDENDVAATLWSIAQNPGAAPGAQSRLFNALTSARLNTAPFGRGYTRRMWETPSPGVFNNVVDTGESVPMLADFLDALICQGLPASVVDAATEPATHYPYPSSTPICP